MVLVTGLCAKGGSDLDLDMDCFGVGVGKPVADLTWSMRLFVNVFSTPGCLSIEGALHAVALTLGGRPFRDMIYSDSVHADLIIWSSDVVVSLLTGCIQLFAPA